MHWISFSPLEGEILQGYRMEADSVYPFLRDIPEKNR
jgi:hypothetical protein